MYRVCSRRRNSPESLPRAPECARTAPRPRPKLSGRSSRVEIFSAFCLVVRVRRNVFDKRQQEEHKHKYGDMCGKSVELRTPTFFLEKLLLTAINVGYFFCGSMYWYVRTYVRGRAQTPPIKDRPPNLNRFFAVFISSAGNIILVLIFTQNL